ncbi:hypothetical protein E8E11_003948 [Didymella keratinophila]|nr:hypothetical protein E8E11_003948 [Didymella keratinophila]
MLSYDKELRLTKPKQHLPNVLENFPKFVKIEILERRADKTHARLLQLYVDIACKRPVYFLYDTSTRRGDFNIPGIQDYISYVKHYGFKPINRKVGRLLKQTSDNSWLGDGCTLHVNGHLCMWNASYAIEFIFFLHGHLDRKLTDTQVSSLAEKLAEGIYMINEPRFCYDYLDVNDTDHMEMDDDTPNLDTRSSAHGETHLQSADSATKDVSAALDRKLEGRSHRGSERPSLPAEPPSQLSALCTASSDSAVEHGQTAATDTNNPRAELPVAASCLVEDYSILAHAQMTQTAVRKTTLDSQNGTPDLAHQSLGEASSPSNAIAEEPESTKKARVRYTPPVWLRRSSSG